MSKTTQFTKIADLTTDVRALIEADLKDGTLGQVAIAEKYSCAKGVVRMVNLKLKAAVIEEEVKTDAAVKAAVQAAVVDEIAAPVAQTKAEKLQALKDQVGEQEVVVAADKPKTPRAKKAPVDTTTRDVLVVTSPELKIGWMTSHILFKNKTEAWVAKDLLRIAKTRKGDFTTNLVAMATADDLLIERNIAVSIEEHEAVMAGHWDRLSELGYTMIGRRPKGFKKAPAPRVKTTVAPQTEADIDAQIEALMAKKAAKAEALNAETAVVDTTPTMIPSHYTALVAETVATEEVGS